MCDGSCTSVAFEDHVSDNHRLAEHFECHDWLLAQYPCRLRTVYAPNGLAFLCYFCGVRLA